MSGRREIRGSARGAVAMIQHLGRGSIAKALGIFVGIYLMVVYGSRFLCNFIAFLYPPYASVKAIESNATEDATKWLTYWVVYSAFALLEFFTDIFLFWIPLYWFLKCLFLLYCMVPTSWNGSLTIYKNVIRPFVLRHQKDVDELVARAKHAADDAKHAAQDVINEVKKAFQAGRETAQDVARDAAGEVIKGIVAKSD